MGFGYIAAQGPVEGSGHHHILVDKPVGYLAPGEKIPFEDGYVHYGKVRAWGGANCAARELTATRPVA
jgi:hypothetical protein